jgi:hypothetical protein
MGFKAFRAAPLISIRAYRELKYQSSELIEY